MTRDTESGKYTILRKGSNAANQSGALGWVPIDTIDAESEQEALDRAYREHTVYNNQILRASRRFPRGYVKSPDGSYWDK